MSNRVIVACQIDDSSREIIHDWVQKIKWTEDSQLKSPHSYHITTMYSPVGADNPGAMKWLNSQLDCTTFLARPQGFEMFTNPGQYASAPVVLTLEAPELAQITEKFLNHAEEQGFTPARFTGGYRAHITLAFSPELPTVDSLPELELNLSSMGLWN